MTVYEFKGLLRAKLKMMEANYEKVTHTPHTRMFPKGYMMTMAEGYIRAVEEIKREIEELERAIGEGS